MGQGSAWLWGSARFNRGESVSRSHHMDPRAIHHSWDDSLPPALVVESEDIVHFDLLMSGDGQVRLGDSFEDVSFDPNTIYNLSGPVAVSGADVGQTLRVDVLELEHGAWGWSAIRPGAGLLPEDFREGYLRTLNLVRPGPLEFAPGIEVPLRPFMGTMGVSPASGMRLPPFPPHRGGGNIDTSYLTTGSSLFLPVWRPLAMFSCGDPHAVQGDGEVCVTALEAPLRGSLRFTLLPKAMDAPAFLTGRASATEGGSCCTMGIAPDLMEGCRQATRSMIAWLRDRHELTPEDAYILCSLAGRLRILEVVDAGMWNVAMCMPLSIFSDRTRSARWTLDHGARRNPRDALHVSVKRRRGLQGASGRQYLPTRRRKMKALSPARRSGWRAGLEDGRGNQAEAGDGASSVVQR